MITVVNSVFANLSVSGSGCALLLDAPYVYSGYGLPTGVSLIQNTITAATGSGGNAAVCVYARRGSAYNNIFHVNAPRDVDFAAENTIPFRHNIVDGAYTPDDEVAARLEAGIAAVRPTGPGVVVGETLGGAEVAFGQAGVGSGACDAELRANDVGCFCGSRQG